MDLAWKGCPRVAGSTVQPTMPPVYPRASLLKAHIRTAQKAQHNIMDGISALQIADGGLSEIQDNLARLRQLTVQAASQTVDDGGRSMIQQASGYRSEIGAKTNRLSAIWNQQANTVENETAAMSQIEDQDIVSGTADTVKYNSL